MRKRGPYSLYFKKDSGFGSYLAALRAERGLTQEQYASFLGVSRRSVIAAEQLEFLWFTPTVDQIRRSEPSFFGHAELRKFLRPPEK
jgi:transcriptional regulator with XRE-family HTH domain